MRLSLPAGNYTARFYRPSEGAWIDSATASGGASAAISRPAFTDDLVLLVRPAGGGPVGVTTPAGAAASGPPPAHAVMTAARQALREYPVFQLQGRIRSALAAPACFITTGGCHD